MTVVPSLLTVIGIVALMLTDQAIGSCSIAGRFGETCLYKCRCANGEACNPTTGQCSNGCAVGWFGPECQYASSQYDVREGLDESTKQWILDEDDTTCNSNQIEPLVTLSLDSPHPLTWVRLVFSNETAYPDDIQLSYKTSSTGEPATQCPAVQKAMADRNTLDVSCPTSERVTEVIISGSNIGFLCSVYISKGRNVALFQSASQTSTHEGWVAENAVDGNIAPDNSTDAVFKQTCTHTRASDITGRWSLDFRRPILPESFAIYNRINSDRETCCEERLVGFTLLALDDQSELVYTYTDPGGPPQAVYTVVPETRLQRPVSQLVITKSASSTTLTLCEVEVFGDSACPDGKYGRVCDGVCNCDDQGGPETCLVSTGGCPSGCQPGFTGEDCNMMCGAGEYGSGCSSTCSPYCAGTDRPCSASDGVCANGCTEGYQPPTCVSECPMTTFGQNCSQNCSATCMNSECDPLTGQCQDCPPGVTGELCMQDCSAGSWGPNCVYNCSIHCASSNETCDRFNGSCSDGCKEGYEPPLCSSESAVAQTQPETTPTDTDSGNSSNVAVIVGATVAAVVFSIACIIAGIFVLRRRKMRLDQSREQQERTINRESTSPSYKTKTGEDAGLVVQYKYPERTASLQRHNQGFNEYVGPQQNEGVNVYEKPREPWDKI